MKKSKKIVVRLLEKDYTKQEKILITLCTFLVGVVVGFIVSPVKKGVHIFSNNSTLSDNKMICGNNHNKLSKSK